MIVYVHLWNALLSIHLKHACLLHELLGYTAIIELFSMVVLPFCLPTNGRQTGADFTCYQSLFYHFLSDIQASSWEDYLMISLGIR